MRGRAIIEPVLIGLVSIFAVIVVAILDALERGAQSALAQPRVWW